MRTIIFARPSPGSFPVFSPVQPSPRWIAGRLRHAAAVAPVSWLYTPDQQFFQVGTVQAVSHTGTSLTDVVMRIQEGALGWSAAARAFFGAIQPRQGPAESPSLEQASGVARPVPWPLSHAVADTLVGSVSAFPWPDQPHLLLLADPAYINVVSNWFNAQGPIRFVRQAVPLRSARVA